MKLHFCTLLVYDLHNKIINSRYTVTLFGLHHVVSFDFISIVTSNKYEIESIRRTIKTRSQRMKECFYMVPRIHLHQEPGAS